MAKPDSHGDPTPTAPPGAGDRRHRLRGRPPVAAPGGAGAIGCAAWRGIRNGWPTERVPAPRSFRATCSTPTSLRTALDGVALRLLHGAFHGVGQWVRGAGPRGRTELRRGRARGRGASASSIWAVWPAKTDDLSPHLRSRHEVGRILRESGVPTIELRASIVLGSGSLSFEMIRALVERLPAMVTPQVGGRRGPAHRHRRPARSTWSNPSTCRAESRVFEIGGADRASYGDLMREYAPAAGPAPGHGAGAGADPPAVQPVARAWSLRSTPGWARS